MRRTTLLLLLLLMLVAACTGAEGDAPAAGGGAGDRETTGEHRRAGEPAADAATVAAEDHAVVLRDEDGTRTLARLDERDGRFEHVALRPGDHDAATVLALTRTDERYELRYVVVDDGSASDLYGFPWRLQIDEDAARHSDAAPLPIWAPDGSALAWLEWDEHGTVLRTVGWMDEQRANNPSEDSAAYRLREVPVGAQLRDWDLGGATSTLVADDGETEWRIELDPGDRAVAMPVDERDG